MNNIMEKIGIIGLCYDENSSFMRGTDAAPQLIRDAFFCDSSNSWSETGLDLSQPDLFLDAGDLNQNSGKHMADEIENAISSLLAKNLTPISLGGDHSVTYPVIKAVAKKHPNLSILHIDAHPDLYHDFEGNRFSHASPFARIMEENLAQRLVQVGIRTMNGHQREQASRFGVEVFEMKNWRDDSDIVFETPVYLSVDLDSLDPAFAPGVSHHEPGGLSTRQLINLIQRINAPLIGADIVEYNPQRDLNNMTAMVAAKIFKEIAAKILESKK